MLMEIATASSIRGASLRASDLRRESDRLATFTGWPLPYIRPEALALYGFFYTGRRDIVQCFFCSVELGDWQEADRVAIEHKKWSRYCPLLTRRPTANVPNDVNFDPYVPDPPDVYGSGPRAGRRLSAGANEPAPAAAGTSSQQAPQPDAGKVRKPQYPRYATEAARLASFESWPKSIKQTPAQMADAGFFYTEKSDIVACFSCGGTLNGWLEGNDPWVEHAVQFSGCHYLNLVKGPEFVQQCQSRQALGSGSKTQTLSKSNENKSEPEDSDASDAKMCKICYANPYNTSFIPCGHVVACGKCASAVDRCPLCNQVFVNVVRIYLS